MTHLRPPGAGVERRHRGGLRRAIGAKIALIDLPVVTDQEALDAGIVVVNGPGNDGESAKQLAVHDIVISPARSMRTLRGEQLVVIAVIACLASACQRAE